jgi:hypothetical protein
MNLPFMWRGHCVLRLCIVYQEIDAVLELIEISANSALCTADSAQSQHMCCATTLLAAQLVVVF